MKSNNLPPEKGNLTKVNFYLKKRRFKFHPNSKDLKITNYRIFVRWIPHFDLYTPLRCFAINKTDQYGKTTSFRLLLPN